MTASNLTEAILWAVENHGEKEAPEEKPTNLADIIIPASNDDVELPELDPSRELVIG
jgi:hypothetical protein